MNGSSHGFQRTLDHIRSIADSEAHEGRLFERLMKTYFTQDPHYKGRFSQVWLWSKANRRICLCGPNRSTCGRTSKPHSMT